MVSIRLKPFPLARVTAPVLHWSTLAFLLASLFMSLTLMGQTADFVRTRMAGRAIVTQYADWSLAATSPVTAVGISTVSLIASTVTLPDGTTLAPIRAGTPLLIRDGDHSEVVIPTQANCNFGASTCNFTADFTETHPGHFSATSGTAGLQEAINDQTSYGGGIVVLPPEWTGAQSVITQASGSNSVLILDERNGGHAWYSWTPQGYSATLQVSSSGTSLTTAQLTSPVLSGTVGANATFTGNPMFTGNTSFHQIGMQAFASSFTFTANVTNASFSAGVLGTLTPNWTALPAGLSSGANSIISATNGSSTITWVAGDHFNPYWTNKPIQIHQGSYTIQSCSSSTQCTLTTNFGGTHGSEAYTNWYALVGTPDTVYLSGAGSAEAFTVLGVGASECPGGGALSICGIPASNHTGSGQIQSATGGIQEAVNSLGTNGGTVMLPDGTTSLLATVLIAYHNSITLRGRSEFSSVLSDQVTGSPAAPAIELLNSNYDYLGYFSVQGSATTGHLIAYLGSEDGIGSSTFSHLSLTGSRGTAFTLTRVSMPAAGLYWNGPTSNLVEVCSITNNGYGIYDGANGSLTDAASTFLANIMASSDDDNLFIQDTYGIDVSGNRINFATGWGINANDIHGGLISGNYFESNRGGQMQIAQTAEGVDFSGNEVSGGTGDGSTGFLVIGPQAGTYLPPTGLHISANYFVVDGSNGTTLQAFIQGGLSSSVIDNNVFDTAVSGTPAAGIILNTYGNTSAGIHNFLYGNVAGDAGGPTHLVVDNTTSPATTLDGQSTFYFQDSMTSKGLTVGVGNPFTVDSNGNMATSAGITAASLAIGGDASAHASARMVWASFAPGSITQTGQTIGQWTPDKALVVTRLQATLRVSPSGCSTNAILQLQQGSSSWSLPLTATSNDSGALSASLQAGLATTVTVSTGASGCTVQPADANISVQYRMQ